MQQLQQPRQRHRRSLAAAAEAALLVVVLLPFATTAAAAASAAAAAEAAAANVGTTSMNATSAKSSATTAAAAAAAPAANATSTNATSANDVEAVRLRRTNGTAIICISPEPAVVACSPDDPAATPTGLQVDVFERAVKNDVANVLGLPETREWRCMDWNDMIDDLALPNGTCYMALGVDILADYTAQNIVFTWPTLTQGLKILTTGRMESQGIWSVFSAFHWSLWLLVGCTFAVVGVMLALFQRCSLIVTDAAMEAQEGADVEAPVPPAPAPAAPVAPKTVQSYDISSDICAQRDNDSSKGAGVKPSAVSFTTPPAILAVQKPPASDDGTIESPSAIAAAAAAARGFSPNGGSNNSRSSGGKKRSSRAHLRRMLRRQLGLQKGQRLAFVSHVGDHVWQAFALGTTITEGGVEAPKSLPGRIVYWTFCLMVMLLMALFTANTAGIVTSMRLSSTISSRADLSGKAVGIWDGYASILANTEIQAVQLPWENDEDLALMVNKVMTGQLKALLIDASSADYIAAFNSSCQLFTVNDVIQQWGNGMALPAGTSNAQLARWNEALLSIQQNTNLLDTLREKYLGTGSSDCGNLAGSGAAVQLQIDQVAGLWVIVALACLLSSLLLVAMFVFRNHASVRKLALAALSGDAAADIEAEAAKRQEQRRWTRSFSAMSRQLGRSFGRR